VGIREQLNQNPAITTGITIGIIVIALGFIVWQIFGGQGGPSAVTEMYYTVDDGQTYFSDDATKVAPFDYNGKEAVRAYVFKCADGKEFVAYLERMNKDVKAKYEEALKAQQDPNNNGQAMMDAEMLAMEGTEVKKPGDPKWHKRQSAEAEKITMINCPDGNNAALEIVLP
jgi:hypothetical protein